MTEKKSTLIEKIIRMDPSYKLEELEKLPVHRLLVLRDSLRGDSDSESDSGDISTFKNLSRFNRRDE